MAETQENRSSFKFQDLLSITANAENEKRRNIIAALVVSLLIATISTRLLLVILLLWAFVGGYYLASRLLEYVIGKNLCKSKHIVHFNFN
jgi:uncharacterized protein YneF (UPF0154 family)